MANIDTPADLAAWIYDKLVILNSEYPDSVDWPDVIDELIGFADALGLSDEVESLGGPIRRPIYVCEVDGQYDYETPLKAVRKKARTMLAGMLGIIGSAGSDPFVPNPLQTAILNALDRRGLKTDDLAAKVCGDDHSRLYRPGGLKELQKLGRVKNKRGVGHYRPDAPPLNKVATK